MFYAKPDQICLHHYCETSKYYLEIHFKVKELLFSRTRQFYLATLWIESLGVIEVLCIPQNWYWSKPPRVFSSFSFPCKHMQNKYIILTFNYSKGSTKTLDIRMKSILETFALTLTSEKFCMT